MDIDLNHVCHEHQDSGVLVSTRELNKSRQLYPIKKILFLKKNLFLLERITDTVRDRENLPPVCSLPKWPELGQSEAKSQELLSGLPYVARAQRLGPSSAFLDHSRELNQKWISQDSD